MMTEIEQKPLPPGNMGLPIVGETFQFLMKGTQYYTEKFIEYGQIFKCYILGSPTIRVSGADNIRTLIGREPSELSMKWPTSVNILMGEKSLATVIGAEHAKLKANMQKAVLSVRLADYLPVIKEHIQAFIQQWIEEGCCGRKVLGYPACESLMADIMLELVLGCRKEDDEEGRVRQAFVDVNRNVFSIPIRFPGGGFMKAMQGRKVISDFVRSRMAGEGTEKGHVSMMDILLSHAETDEGMDEDMILDNGISLLLSGLSSTSGAMTCLLLLLGKHPDVLEKVREELSAVGLSKENIEEDLNYDILQKLEYVHCVEKELLRYLPPIGGCFRKTEKQMELDKYKIPKDWTVIYSIRDTHNISSKLLSDGNIFNPSRWLKKDQSEQISTFFNNSSSCHYIPFGSGARMCFGRQIARLILHTFITELTLLTRWDVLNPNCPIVHLPITKPSDDLPVIFHEI